MTHVSNEKVLGFSRKTYLICSHSFIHSPKIIQHLICAITVGSNLKCCLCFPVTPPSSWQTHNQLMASAPVALLSGLQAHLYAAGLSIQPAPSSCTSHLTSPMALGHLLLPIRPNKAKVKLLAPGPAPARSSQSFPPQEVAALPFCPSLKPGTLESSCSSLSLTSTTNLSTHPLALPPERPPASRTSTRTQGPDSCRKLTAAAHSHPCPILCSQQPVAPSQLTSAHAALPLNSAVLHHTPGLTPPRTWP